MRHVSFRAFCQSRLVRGGAVEYSVTVCMYVYMYVGMYVCMYVCICVCIQKYIYLSIYMYVCMYVCECVYVFFICTGMHTHTCTSAHLQISL